MAFDDSILNQSSQSPPANTSAVSTGFDDSILSSKSQTQEPTIAETYKKNTDTIASRANAVAIGVERGVGAFSSTLQKLITPVSSKVLRAVGVPEKYIQTPESAQQTYDELDKSYQTDPDSVAHPVMSGLGNLAGQAAMTAPLAAATGGVGELAAGGAADLGAGLGLQSAARFVGDVAGNATQGGIMGGSMNQAGQDPNQLWNASNARTGALVGAALTPAQRMVSSFSNKLTNTENLTQSLKDQGFSSRAMASDMSGNVSQILANKVLQKIPLVGTMPYRVMQGRNIQSDIQNYIGDVSQSTIDNTKTKLANVIDSHATQMNQMEDNAWDNFNQRLNDNAIPAIQRNNSQQDLDALQSYTTRPLSQSNNVPLDELKSNPNILSTNLVKEIQNSGESLDPQDHLALQRNVWNEYSSLQRQVNRGNASPDTVNAANLLRNTYFNMKSDLQDAVSNTSAEPAFAEANAVTTANKSLFDPKYNKPLVNAIDDMSQNQRGIDKYINYLTSPTTNTRDIKTQIGFLGDEGTQAVSQIGLKNLMSSSLDNSVNDEPVLNLNKFFNNYNNMTQSSQALIHQPAIQQLKGLQTVANQFLKSQRNNASNMGDIVSNADLRTAGIVGGAMELSGHAATGASLMLGTGALSFLSRFAPIKSALSNVNSLVQLGGMKPGLSQYLLNKANQTLVRNGVTMTIDHRGQVNLDKSDEQVTNYKNPRIPGRSQNIAPVTPSTDYNAPITSNESKESNENEDQEENTGEE